MCIYVKGLLCTFLLNFLISQATLVVQSFYVDDWYITREKQSLTSLQKVHTMTVLSLPIQTDRANASVTKLLLRESVSVETPILQCSPPKS